ncbi:hypothetical protein GX586_12610 [bacterium]|nr:hypothetical protein [bacterium]
MYACITIATTKIRLAQRSRRASSPNASSNAFSSSIVIVNPLCSLQGSLIAAWEAIVCNMQTEKKKKREAWGSALATMDLGRVIGTCPTHCYVLDSFHRRLLLCLLPGLHRPFPLGLRQ